MPENPDFTPRQKREIDLLLAYARMVRGAQVGIAALGAYLATVENRGWPAFLIGIAIALWMQTQLPALPPWLEKQRPKD